MELYEISVVTWAMNEQALITDYKSMLDRAGEISGAVRDSPGWLKGADAESVKKLGDSLRAAADRLERMAAGTGGKAKRNMKKEAPAGRKHSPREIEIIRR